MPEDAKEAEKETEKGKGAPAVPQVGVGEKGTATAEPGLWICPWCGYDCHGERNYYYHIRKCDKAPEDQVADKDRAPVEQMKKEEPFIINIFEERAEEPEVPAKSPETAPKQEENPEEFPYKCGYCGEGLKKKLKFCPECGKPLEWAG